jgi:hypothetical protein
MEANNESPQLLGKSPESGVRGTLGNAARFWEPRRILYNLLLTLVAIFWVLRTWPHFRPALVPSSLAKLSILAILANICYSAAYAVDIPMQQTVSQKVLLKSRWILFFLGSVFAMVFESYWILDEIYPDFG